MKLGHTGMMTVAAVILLAGAHSVGIGPASAAPAIPGMLCDGPNPCPKPPAPFTCVPCTPTAPNTTQCGWKDALGNCHTPTGQLFANKQLRSCRPTATPGATCRESTLPCYILKDCVNRVAAGLQAPSLLVAACGYEGSRLATNSTTLTACNTTVNLLPNAQGTMVWGTALNRVAPPEGWGDL